VGRIRKRPIQTVVSEVFDRAIETAGAATIDYVASTGEGEDIPFATGHFYGMTTHARGALHLDPRARIVVDIGALHTRAVLMDERGQVQSYKMTSQCASGSGQFLENIARYLGVSLAEVGELSRAAATPEKVSSICAVLAETDVINMVSRGIATPDILRGIHESMAGRVAKLVKSLASEDTVVFLSGGLSADVGLRSALDTALREESKGLALETSTHPLGIACGAIGAAIWGDFRHRRLGREEKAWTRAIAS
jgi:benzoyl-CoA reductase subunit D